MTGTQSAHNPRTIRWLAGGNSGMLLFLQGVLPMQEPNADQLDQQLLFEVIENQLADGYPVKTTETLMRLRMTGHSREDALELIACALAPEMYAVIEQRQAFDLARYEAHLDLLPETPWINE